MFVAGLLLALHGAGPALAQSVSEGRLVLDARTAWAYAESLFQGGEYYRAISEYKRLLHYFPESTEAPLARVRIGEASLQGGEPAAAIAAFTGMLGDEAMAPARAELLFLRGLGWLELERGEPYRLRAAHIDRALGDLREIPPDWSGAAAVQGFVQALDAPEDVPSKSAWLAGGLSALLPGSGSAYVGNWSEAALALFFNALFIGAAVQAFDEDDDDAGAFFALGALAVYGGAIYAAANGAHRFNDVAHSSYLDAQRTRFGIVLRPGGMAGLLQQRF